jgi:hypothetical protein
MSVRLTCRACAAHLKLPPGCTKTKVRCPKCDARMDVSAAISARAYLPTTSARVPEPTTTDTPLPEPRATAEREEDPLPYLSLDPATRPPAPQTPPPLPDAKPQDEPPLSLDDSPPEEPPQAPPPFRVAARVTADGAKQFVGPCEGVLVPHGLFLESVPFRPFAYAPVGSPAFTPTPGAVVVSLPDGRALTVEFLHHDGGRVAEDVAAFLAGRRGVPEAREYRRSPPWLVLLAVIFAVGAGAAPVAAARGIDLDPGLGLWFGVGFAVLALFANAAVAFFSRMPLPGKVAVMAATGAALTGVCLFAAAAYVAGRRHEAQNRPPEPPLQPGPTQPGSPGSPPGERRHLPTAVDLAYRDGVYRFDDGPDDVTALAVRGDGAVLVVGHRDGTTHVWRLDGPAIDPFAIGPRCDGAPSRIAFDSTGTLVSMTCATGTVIAPWNDPPAAPLKIPGEMLAAFPFSTGERFATLRGNSLVVRQVPTGLVKNPPGKTGFYNTMGSEEPQPPDVVPRLMFPQRPTFLAWHPTGQLIGGLRDGSVVSWGAGVNASPVSREHKTAIRAWAASPSTWDFATGDDRGMVGLWENKSLRPRLFAGATGAVTQLAFSPSGSHLAVGDTSGAIRIWSLGAERAVARINRVAVPVAFGPWDDTILLSDGKRLELWSLDELAKQP